jgi:hypothetical protein
MAIGGSTALYTLIVVGVVGVFGIITFALAAATLGTVNKQYNDLNQQIGALKQQVDNYFSSPPTTTTASTVTVTSTTANTSRTTNSSTPNTSYTADTIDTSSSL